LGARPQGVASWGEGGPLGTSRGRGRRTTVAEPGRPSLGYRPELDGLRGIAVALVVVYHVGVLVWPDAADVMPAGALGVDLFFVLSGFLITTLLLDEARRRDGAVDLGAFAQRRARRLVPGLVALLAVVVLVAVTTTFYVLGDALATAVWALTFTYNWALVDGRAQVLGHLWSVAIEGQFYLVWAVAVVVALRLRHALRALAVLAVVVIAAVMWWRAGRYDAGMNPVLLYVSTPARFDAPLVGALAALAMASGWFDRLRGRAAALLGLAGLVAVVAAAAVLHPVDAVLHRGGFTVIAVAAACAVVGAVRAGDRWPLRPLSASPLVALGTISYALYLWHVPVFQWTVHLFPSWWTPLRAAVAVLWSVAAATLSYRLVERRFLRRHHHRYAAATLDAGPPAVAAGSLAGEAQAPVAMGKQRSSSAPKA
jgi:peptidoglycan/LPS O-acetylase OafA/YrhL